MQPAASGQGISMRGGREHGRLQADECWLWTCCSELAQLDCNDLSADAAMKSDECPDAWQPPRKGHNCSARGVCSGLWQSAN